MALIKPIWIFSFFFAECRQGYAVDGVPQQVPFHFGHLSCLLVLQDLHNRVIRLSAELGIRHYCSGDVWGTRMLGVAEFLQQEANLAAHQSVIHITIHTVVAACGEYTIYLGTSGDD